MMCGCDLQGNCEWCDHYACMTGGPALVQKANKTMTSKNPLAPKAAFAQMQKKAKKAVAKKLRQQKKQRDSKTEAFGKLMKHKVAQKGRPGKRGGKDDDD